jgi:hypothetical protein
MIDSPATHIGKTPEAGIVFATDGVMAFMT